MRIVSLSVEPLSVPLVEPFVIATASLATTRSALVTVVLDDGASRASGIGEAATLAPVTPVDQDDVVAHVESAAVALIGAAFAGHASLRALLDEALGDDVVARAGVEVAVLDAWAKLSGLPLARLLGAEARGPFVVVTDVTIPIAAPREMGRRAARWRALGFHAFKVKVGRDADDDARAIEAILDDVAGARLRLDGNQGQTPAQALALLARARKKGALVECLEQPCPRADLEGMARLVREAGCAVVADEAVRTRDDLDRVVRAKACTHVNLKLVKHGGPAGACVIGRAAQRAGLGLMVGAMVETRLGIAAMAQATAALGGADFVDLDTAFLLASDPFVGGYDALGDRLTIAESLGHGVDVAL